MRPVSIPAFTSQMNTLFNLKNGHNYLDGNMMMLTRKIELDLMKFDDLMHERHGNYEEDLNYSLSDLVAREYGVMAHYFLSSMLNIKQEVAID